MTGLTLACVGLCFSTFCLCVRAVIVQPFALNAATASCYIEVFFRHKVCFSPQPFQ